MTQDEMRELVKECGLDWHRGYMPLFDDDPTNRYAVLIEAVAGAVREKCANVAVIIAKDLEIERLRFEIRKIRDCKTLDEAQDIARLARTQPNTERSGPP